LNNCFSSPDNNNSNDNTEIDYEIIQINENNCTQAESNKMVPAFIQQKFLQIIASSNDEVNEQSKKINSSKRVLDLEIASGLQPRITSQFQKYNISQGQSKLCDNALTRFFVCYRRTLSTKLIDKEVARISISIEKELKSEENLSLVVDSWKICSDIVKKISFGKNVLSQCQKFVSYFQGSYKAGAQFCNEIVEAFIMGGGLKSSVVTRWSSAWDCCNSVLRLENIFRNMIEKDPGCMSTNLYNLVNDRNFWANVECLTYVSSPAKKAVKCIESANSTLADFFLILIQMAATIKQLPISDSTEHKVFHSVIRTALEVWKNLGGGDKSAQYTLAIVPHSASCECLFSVLSWFTQKCRNRLDVEKVSNMAKLHSFYTMNANSELNYITQEMSEEQLINALHDYGNGLFSGEGERENFNRPLEDIEDYGDPDYNIDVIRDSGI
ncbi:8609_t:CDS:2, partial [Entrophospora sp. SA101]